MDQKELDQMRAYLGVAKGEMPPMQAIATDLWIRAHDEPGLVKKLRNLGMAEAEIQAVLMAHLLGALGIFPEEDLEQPVLYDPHVTDAFAACVEEAEVMVNAEVVE